VPSKSRVANEANVDISFVADTLKMVGRGMKGKEVDDDDVEEYRQQS
jgi:hypothetical protein